MKKRMAALLCTLTILCLCSGCTLLAMVENESTGATPTAKATATAEPTATATPTVSPTPTAEPTAEPTATPSPAKALQGCTWIAYAETSGVEYFVFELTFNADGTMTYMAGWYLSEVAYQGTGTYTADGETLTYALTSDSFEPATMNGSVAYSLDGGQLTLSGAQGDALTYLLESGSLTFAVKGSEQDIPPTF